MSRCVHQRHCRKAQLRAKRGRRQECITARSTHAVETDVVKAVTFAVDADKYSQCILESVFVDSDVGKLSSGTNGRMFDG